MIFVLIWLGLGFISSVAAIAYWYPTGVANRDGQLYVAALAPLSGPALLVAVAISLVKKYRAVDTQ